MKPRDKGGVVDSRLNVYGGEGLKVADMSICPTNVSCVSCLLVSIYRSLFIDPCYKNTYSTAIVIGEKAAMVIAEELGIKGV